MSFNVHIGHGEVFCFPEKGVEKLLVTTGIAWCPLRYQDSNEKCFV